MIDEERQLHQDPHLLHLLEHYAATEDREAWLDRVMNLDGLTGPELVRRHGELLAFGWIEQNTGAVPRLEVGACPGCYRATPAGRRALAEFRRSDTTEEIAA